MVVLLMRSRSYCNGNTYISEPGSQEGIVPEWFSGSQVSEILWPHWMRPRVAGLEQGILSLPMKLQFKGNTLLRIIALF